MKRIIIVIIIIACMFGKILYNRLYNNVIKKKAPIYSISKNDKDFNYNKHITKLNLTLN